MRILILSPYFPPEGGGLERYALNRAVRLSREGNEVRVLCMSRESSGRGVFEGVSVERIKAGLILSNTPLSIRFLLRAVELVRDWKPDAIETHTPVPSAFLVAFIVSSLFSLPLRVFYHTVGLAKGDALLDFLAGLYIPLENALLKKADVLSVSRTVMRHLAGRGIVSSLRPPEVGLPKADDFRKGKVILFAGQLGRYHRFKNLEALLRAFADVSGDFPEWELWVAGEGDMKDYYAGLAGRLGIWDRVKFFGRVEREEMLNLYSRASILVLPSSFESLGLAVLEAAGFAVLPVVSPQVFINFSSTPLSKALIVSPPGELGEVLRDLLSSPKVVKKLGRMARDAINF